MDRNVDREQDIAWLLANQASLNQRLERVEASVVFRTLRRLGRWGSQVRGRQSAAEGYAAWRKAGGGSMALPEAPAALPKTASCPSFAVFPFGSPEWQHSAADYIVFCDNPAGIHPAAFAYFAAAAPADYLYCDEELTDAAGLPLRPLFKPDWSPGLFQTARQLGGLVAVRRETLGTGNLLKHCTVVHVPAVLYRSGTCEAPAPTSSPVPVCAEPLVSVIICTRTASLLSQCLAGLQARTNYANLQRIVVQHLGSSSPSEEEAVERVIADHNATRIPYAAQFNFARMNNLGAEAASGEVLLFLNDDVDPLQADWLRRMVHRLQDSTTGAVGAKLTFPDGTLQHAGVAAYGTDGAWHPGRNTPPSALWPWNAHSREVSAVTAACLAIRSSDFHRLGRFDPAFPVNFNDVDLCFRLREAGLSVVIDIEAHLQHSESRTRVGGSNYEERRAFFRKWPHRLQRPDPFYSPHLAQNTEEFRLR